MEIPYRQLSKEALEGIVKDFVLREGTEYGEREFSLKEKVEQVMNEVQSGRARIVFDPDGETCNILPVVE